MKKQKTIRQLYTEFCERYTTDEVADDNEKQVLLQYLSNQMKRFNGDFIHIPSHYLCELIRKHLGYQQEELPMYTK